MTPTSQQFWHANSVSEDIELNFGNPSDKELRGG